MTARGQSLRELLDRLIAQALVDGVAMIRESDLLRAAAESQRRAGGSDSRLAILIDQLADEAEGRANEPPKAPGR